MSKDLFIQKKDIISPNNNTLKGSIWVRVGVFLQLLQHSDGTAASEEEKQYMIFQGENINQDFFEYLPQNIGLFNGALLRQHYETFLQSSTVHTAEAFVAYLLNIKL